MKLYRTGEVRTHKSTYPLQASNILKKGYHPTAGDINLDTISLKIDSAISSILPYAWNTLAYSDGVHKVELSAVDKAGNSALASITVILDNTPPAVSLTSPVNNSYVSRIVIIEGIAADSNLSGMRLSIDDIEVSSSLPYSWNTSKTIPSLSKNDNAPLP